MKHLSLTKRCQTSFSRFSAVKREAIKLTQSSLVKTSYLKEEGAFPLVVQPAVNGLNAVDWAANNREFIERELLRHGALLFRDFHVEDAARFERFARCSAGELLDYRERAAPRMQIGAGVYTSTEFPADQYIPLHHEMSYSHNWPTKIFFFCQQPADEGGATPIADDRKVFHLIDPRIKERFIEKRVMYVRNYGEGVDLTWQEAFQTTERSAVEEYCRRSHTQFEWKDGDRLRTRQVRQAVATHPQTGETVWFNHTHMFHYSNLEPEVRRALLEEFGEDELPRNACYGDGSPIEASVLEEIRRAYSDSAVTFRWQKGDIMLLDNFLASHGREPFKGGRKILVAMAELFTNHDFTDAA